MAVIGAAPAAASLAPHAPGDVAVIAAPWADPGAALSAALAMGGAIKSVSADGRTVVTHVEAPAALAVASLGAGVLILRGDAMTCNRTRAAVGLASAPPEDL